MIQAVGPLLRYWWYVIISGAPRLERSVSIMSNSGISLVVILDEGESVSEEFIRFYRQRGVSHFFFLFVGFPREVKFEVDATVYSVKAGSGSKGKLHFAITYILQKYCRGRWVFLARPSELIVYPFCDSRDFNELTRALESMGRRSLGCACSQLTLSSKGPDDLIVRSSVGQKITTRRKNSLVKVSPLSVMTDSVEFKFNLSRYDKFYDPSMMVGSVLNVDSKVFLSLQNSVLPLHELWLEALKKGEQNIGEW